MRRVFLVVAVFLNGIQGSQGQVASMTTLLDERGVMALRPMEVYANPQVLNAIWIEEAWPIEFYSIQEKENQRRINEETTDMVITYSPREKETEWTATDHEEITPYTWKWIDLEMKNTDSTLTKINLRRPNTWIRQMAADNVGNKIYLDMHELGVVGWATVTSIRVNQLDTRFWNDQRYGDYVVRPITGKFEHESSNVYSIQFDDRGEPVGATGEHPFWSIDRNGWIGAQDLKLGESVKTFEGSTELVSRSKNEGRQTVYNIEVYRDHNYLVSMNKILVHNTKVPGNILDRKIGDFMGDLNINGRKIFPGDPHTDVKGVNEVIDLMKSGKFDWNLTPEKDRIAIAMFPDGRLQITNGHHRIYAAKLMGIEIPWSNSKVVVFERIPSGQRGHNLDWKDVDWTEKVRDEILHAAE